MAYLTDGWQTLISFSLAPSVLFRAKEVQPPDLDAGGEVDTTVMANNRWRTKQPKHLVTLGDTTLVAQYDPQCYTDVVTTLLGKNGQITITFPDGRTITFWGWVDKFTPSNLKEGEFPTAEVKIHSSNQDNSGTEQPPVIV